MLGRAPSARSRTGGGRSVRIVTLARQGALERLASSRPGKSSAELALEEAQAEIDRLKETITEQAVELRLYRGIGRWD